MTGSRAERKAALMAKPVLVRRSLPAEGPANNQLQADGLAPVRKASGFEGQCLPVSEGSERPARR